MRHAPKIRIKITYSKSLCAEREALRPQISPFGP